MLELAQINMNNKERIKDFNQRHMTLLNKFPADSIPAENMQIDFDTRALPITIAMFCRRSGKRTLAKMFDKAVSMEKDMISLDVNPGTEEKKPAPPAK